MERHTLIPSRRLVLGLTVLLIGTLVPSALAAGGTFTDDDTSIFEADIEWLAGAGVTRGCNPPDNTLFCPDDPVTRGQMAAFMRRFAAFLGAEDGVVSQADHATTADSASTADSAVTAGTAAHAASAADANRLDGKDSTYFGRPVEGLTAEDLEDPLPDPAPTNQLGSAVLDALATSFRTTRDGRLHLSQSAMFSVVCPSSDTFSAWLVLNDRPVDGSRRLFPVTADDAPVTLTGVTEAVIRAGRHTMTIHAACRFGSMTGAGWWSFSQGTVLVIG